jgi:hypothetical protein
MRGTKTGKWYYLYCYDQIIVVVDAHAKIVFGHTGGCRGERA